MRASWRLAPASIYQFNAIYVIIALMDSRGTLIRGSVPQTPARNPEQPGDDALAACMQRRPQYRPRDPFCCAYCGSRTALKSFATVYGNGSTIAHSRRGLILKTGWSETFRQSILAKKCSPPKPRGAFWRTCVLLLGLALYAAASRYQLHSEFSEAGAIVLVFGVFLLADAIRWNRFKYPVRMASWENSYLCLRCSKVTVIEPVYDQ